MRNLTTCGRCGGTASWRPGSGWAHSADTPRTRGHAVDPDDSYAATGADEAAEEERYTDPWLDPDAAAALNPPPF